MSEDNETVTFLLRVDGSTNFYRNWTEYKSGFGDIDRGGFWLGLDDLHHLTYSKPYGLEVHLADWDLHVYRAMYRYIVVGPESDNYPLTVSGYNTKSNAGNCLQHHNNNEFTTYDNDNDKWANDSNCAASYMGGWWYGACAWANPTGLYLTNGTGNIRAIFWWLAKDSYYSMKYTRYTLVPRK